MMHLLYYWKYQQQDHDRYAQSGGTPSFRLIQNSPNMLKGSVGDSLWAVCRRSRDRAYVPAAHFIISRVETLTKPHHYGKHVVHGDQEQSRYFDVDACPDIQALIRSLSFSPKADVLGYSFQGHNGVRVLDDSDHRSLEHFCMDLPTANY